MTVLLWTGMALLGGLGACARHLLATGVPRRAAGVPLGLLLVNVSGALALGVLVGAGVRGDALLLAGTGALGAYTTFSTWMLDVATAPRRDVVAVLLVPLALGLLAALVGLRLG